MEYIKSGSTLLDLSLGGGHALGHIGLVSGDWSAGKTQLAITAAAQFHKQYPKGKIYYVDAECAFDVSYAMKLGLPETQVSMHPCTTVAEFGDRACLLVQNHIKENKSSKKPQPLYLVLDSLDTLIVDDLKNKNVSEQSGFSGARRAGEIGDVVKKLVPLMEEVNGHWTIVGQNRDNTEGYGDPKKVSGGNAPKFYCSQWTSLSVKEKLFKVVKGERIHYGVVVKAVNKKNKCGVPFKTCEYTIIFNKGIDDVSSCLNYLDSKKLLTQLPEYLLTDSIKSEEPNQEPAEDAEEGDDVDEKTGKKKAAKKSKLIISRIAALKTVEAQKEAVSAIRQLTENNWESTQRAVEDSIPFFNF